MALNATLNLFEARALFEGPERMVHVRVAEQDGRIYLDLANAAWQAVEIDTDGWRIVAEPPVRFRRPPGLLPLLTAARKIARTTEVVAQSGGRDDLVLITAWLLAALRPASW